MDSALTPQNNTQQTSETSIPQVGSQLKYPLDYETQRVLEEFLRTRMQAYPVGSIYMNATDSTNPGTIFGYGIWTAIEGYVIAGYKAGDFYFGTPGLAFGSTTHTLTVAEMPAHTHDVAGVPVSSVNFNGGYGAGTNQTVTSTSAGGGDAHNNIQPTLVAYVWQRIS